MRDSKRPPPARGPQTKASAEWHRWITQLRFATLALMAVTVLVAPGWLGLEANLVAAASILAGSLLIHALLAAIRRRTSFNPDGHWGFFVDVVTIGALLAASGGPANPFSVVFMVYVAVGGSVLPTRSAWALALVAALGFAALFALPTPSGHDAHAHHHMGHGQADAFSAHLHGMLVAFVVAAGLVAVALTRMRKLLRERDAELDELRRHAEADKRFAALGTLAAGTAHELATPLATIAVLAGELGESDDPELQRQATTMRGQVRRCRDILTKLQSGGDTESVVAASAPVGDRVRKAVADWQAGHPDATVTTRGLDRVEMVAASAGDIEAAVCAMLDNALHAISRASNSDPIEVFIEADAEAATVCVVDGGNGVAEEVRDRLGEPFVTTKAPGEGMGLGLFLVRSLAERSGGSMDIRPRATGTGTEVRLRLGLARSADAPQSI